jgi:hypothetical protein
MNGLCLDSPGGVPGSQDHVTMVSGGQVTVALEDEALTVVRLMLLVLHMGESQTILSQPVGAMVKICQPATE